jgi:hypothetical protein
MKHAKVNETGMVLMIVLWVLLLLTVIAWTSSRQSQMELRMTGFQTDSVRAYYLARAGISRALVFLREDKLKDHGVLGEEDLIEIDDKDENWLYDAPSESWNFNPDAYGIDPDDDEDEWGATLEGARGFFTTRVEDISGLMNINYATFDHIRRLLEVLGVDEDYAMAMAAAIIDYIDPDDQPTILDEVDVPGWEFGDQSTEDYYYNPGQDPEEIDMAGPERMLKNGPLSAVEELLLVPGMKDVIFYGEDDNGNGELDDNEDDGDLTPPYDNEDGELQLGLKDFVTVFGGLANERGFRPNLNSAPFEVIQALLWGPDEKGDQAEKGADEIVTYRNGNDDFLGSDDDKRFRTLPHTDENNEGIDRAGLDPLLEQIVTQTFGVASDYFRIVSTGEVNEVRKTLKMTVLRTFQEELALEGGGAAPSRFDRDEEQVEQVELLVIDFEEEG